MSAYKFRIFANGDDAVRNGSFRRVFIYPASLRGVSVYMNGDYMGFIEETKLKTIADCNQEAERMMREDSLVEYTQKRWSELAPACFH